MAIATGSEVLVRRSLGSQLLYTGLGIGLGGLFLYLTLRDVALSQVWVALREANLLWLPLLALLLLLDYWLRSMRWRCMFPPQLLPSRREAFDAFMIGALSNNILPGRIGDLLRAAVIGRHLPALGTAGALGSILVEKILDGLMLLMLLVIAFLLTPLPDSIATAGLWAFAGFGGASAVLLVLRMTDISERLQMRAKRGGKLAALVVDPILRLVVGLHGLHSGRRFLALMGISLPIWTVEMGSLVTCFRIFDLMLPPEAALVAIIMLSVATMLPAAPGFVGTYQFFIVTALSLYGVEHTAAVALSIFLNVFVIALTTLIGVAAILVEGGLSDSLNLGRAKT